MWCKGALHHRLQRCPATYALHKPLPHLCLQPLPLAAGIYGHQWQHNWHAGQHDFCCKHEGYGSADSTQ